MSEKDNKVTEENKGQKKPAEVWSEKAESKSPEISPEEMKTLASAYAKYLAEKKMKPGDATFIEPEELTGKAPEVKAEATAETPAKKPAAPETKAEAPVAVPAKPEMKAEAAAEATSAPEANAETAAAAPAKPAEKKDEGAAPTKEDQMKIFAAEYARMLREKGLKPGDASFAEPEELTGKAPEVKAEATAETPAKKPAAPETKAEAPVAAPAKPEMKAEAPAEAPAKPEEKKAEGAAPTKEDKMKIFAAEYARMLKEKGLKPGEESPAAEVPKGTGLRPGGEVPEGKGLKAEEASPETEVPKGTGLRPGVKVPEGKGLKAEDSSPDERATKETGLKPEELTGKAPEVPAGPEPAGKDKKEEKKEAKKETPAEAPAKKDTPGDRKTAAAEKKKEKAEQKKKAKQQKKKAKARAAAEKRKAAGAAEAPFFRIGKIESMLASALDTYDRLQDSSDESFSRAGRDFVKGAHNMAAAYKNSRRQIGMGLLIVGVLAAGILVIFDQFTVYEYAYNGKVLGYVKAQEEVTEVLDIAGEKLSQNNGGTAPVEFVANQNVTFNPVDGRGKSTDDMDTAVNKLIYMTDIETEAFAVYDGDHVVAIVKDQASAEKLLEDALASLSRPDIGMELVSAEFENELSIRPVNVLLSSVQSSNKALSLMTGGGEMETLHIVEEGETVESIAKTFGVDTVNVFTYGEEADEDEDGDIESEDSNEEDEEDASGEESGEEDSAEDSGSEEDSSEGDSSEENSDEESASEEDGESSAAVTVETDVTAGDESGSSVEIMQGDMVCIKSVVEPVSVRMVEEGKMKEIIEYETIKKKSDEYYQGDTHLEQEGENGVQIFEGTLTKVAGEVVDRKEVSTSVIRNKQDKIILVGTKERPKTAPTGTYAMPLEYYVVTSEFGARWGRMHTGIDFGDPTGTPIYASDGGTVITAGYSGGYGLCIDIDHENGRVTRYGHCSAINVSVGDKVYQGQQIGLVGSTGNSTGPHLHFEVIIDGVQHNPREFLDF